jgi:hypothetical protein
MPTLHEVPEVAQLLVTIVAGEPVTHGALAVIPLLALNLDDPDWLTLDEAGDSARVTEVSEAGGVPFLKVANGADRPLPLLDGEELIGATQNRIRNTTVLVAARTEVTIPVSCVEQERWGYRGRQFRQATPRSTPPSARCPREPVGARGPGAPGRPRGSMGASRRSGFPAPGGQRDAGDARRLCPPPDGPDGRPPGPGRQAGPDRSPQPRLCAGYVADAIGRKPEPWQWLDAGSEGLAQGQAEFAPTQRGHRADSVPAKRSWYRSGRRESRCQSWRQDSPRRLLPVSP